MSTAIEVEKKNVTRLVPQYKVIGHNDTVTQALFVVTVLMQVFRKPEAEAIELMQQIHNTGAALIVVLPLEQAELRVDQVHSLARAQKFPLTFTLEPA